MKLKLNKSVTINWVRNKGKDEHTEVYPIVEGVLSPELPDDVAKYVLEKYKDHIIGTEKPEDKEEKSLDVLVNEAQESAPTKEKEYQEHKVEETTEKKTGINLSDVAKQQ